VGGDSTGGLGEALKLASGVDSSGVSAVAAADLVSAPVLLSRVAQASAPGAIAGLALGASTSVVLTPSAGSPMSSGVRADAASSFRLQPRAAFAITPLSESRSMVRFTASRALRDKIRQAQDLMRHQAPSGDLAIVFERALDLLIAERRKQHFGDVQKPRAARSVPRLRSVDELASRRKTNTRYIPRAVRRAVVERDAGRCTFVSPDGWRCSARGHLEFDHIVPFARGGRATLDNLRLRCRSHNALLAERVFGRAFIKQRVTLRHPLSPLPVQIARTFKQQEASEGPDCQSQAAWQAVSDSASGLSPVSVQAAQAPKQLEASDRREYASQAACRAVVDPSGDLALVAIPLAGIRTHMFRT
jgi:5-methylcytosine-specific restriction endonuclease McrA